MECHRQRLALLTFHRITQLAKNQLWLQIPWRYVVTESCYSDELAEFLFEVGSQSVQPSALLSRHVLANNVQHCAPCRIEAGKADLPTKQAIHNEVRIGCGGLAHLRNSAA